jgi:Bardet-Biedl syndrome 1 protein
MDEVEERASQPRPSSSLSEAAARLTETAKKLSLSSEGGTAAPLQKLWLEAWHDPVAGVKAFGNCITTADLFGDGDWRLVVASFDKTLKVRYRLKPFGVTDQNDARSSAVK